MSDISCDEFEEAVCASEPENECNSLDCPNVDMMLGYIEPSYMELHIPYLKQYKWNCGTTRASYVDRDKGVVYKVPLNDHGFDANIRDSEHSKGNKWKFLPKEVVIAECSLGKDMVLTMEYVIPIMPWDVFRNSYDGDVCKGYPAWASEVDSGQIGYNSRGEIVAYDL